MNAGEWSRRAAVIAAGIFYLGVGSKLSGVAPEWESGEGWRRCALEDFSGTAVGFEKLGVDRTGVEFRNEVAEQKVAFNRNLENGSGVALGDVDGDGLCDVYFAGLDSENRLYRNLGGFRFEDITSAAGVACAGQPSTGVALADVEGDGDLDLLVNALGGGTRLFLNDGHGQFTERKEAGLATTHGSTSMALADLDGDGDLDLYVTNYRETNYKDFPPGVQPDIRMVDGKPVASPADRFLALPATGDRGVVLIELGEEDFLYWNDGAGRFRRERWTDGYFLDAEGRPLAAAPQGWGLSVVLRDLNGDDRPDIYVCNDYFYSRDFCWINEGGGQFREIRRGAIRNMPESSMAADVADINRDGRADLLVVDMLSRHHRLRQVQHPSMVKHMLDLPEDDPLYRVEFMRNMLYLGRDDGYFAEIARLAGVQGSDWSWSIVFLDVDLDGYEDVLVSNGHGHDVINADVMRALGREKRDLTPSGRLRQLRRFPPLLTANTAFRNRGDLTFQETGDAWGWAEVGISHGIALGDLDNDGDLDAVVNNYHRPAGIFRNRAELPRLAVRLKGQPPNTRGIGAHIRVTGGPVPQSQEMIAGGRYVSSDDTIRSFAAGAGPMAIEVRWAGGAHSLVPDVEANFLYEVAEPPRPAGASAEEKVAPSPAPPVKESSRPIFNDASKQLDHTHKETDFDDFVRQPLLSRKLSRGGPGVAWFDLDRDGWEELIIGAGRSGTLEVLRNVEGERFYTIPGPPARRDQTAILGWLRADGKPTLLAGTSNYEDGAAAGPSVRLYDVLSKHVNDLLPAWEASLGPMAMADVDIDGDLDLFLGGQVVPGRYPAPASSRLYRNEGDQWLYDTSHESVFEQVGVVNGAVFSDLDNDGWPDLALACEWGPVRIFLNERGTLHESTRELGTAAHTGWWQGITAADVDGDGRMDLIATNWGRNTPFRPRPGYPLQLHYGDLDGDGNCEILEAYHDAESGNYVPERTWDRVAQALPSVKARFPSFAAFAQADMETIIGPWEDRLERVQAATLDSTVFLNQEDGFAARALPVEAQFAPAFGVCASDFNGDGYEDLFLAQNFFAVPGDISRYDAGFGVLLTGDGGGNFHALPSKASGIRILGQQRGCAVGDFNRDGRPDLAVGQNRSETRLFTNHTATPGLRVALVGPGGNRDGVGAVLALVGPNGRGLTREIHRGSGFWSQDSPTVILTPLKGAEKLWVRWPGGHEKTVELPEGAKEIRVDPAGNVARVR